jgi:hypothetical protein
MLCRQGEVVKCLFAEGHPDCALVLFERMLHRQMKIPILLALMEQREGLVMAARYATEPKDSPWGGLRVYMLVCEYLCLRAHLGSVY